MNYYRLSQDDRLCSEYFSDVEGLSFYACDIDMITTQDPCDVIDLWCWELHTSCN